MNEDDLIWIVIALLIGFFSKHIIENLVCKNVCPLVEGVIGGDACHKDCMKNGFKGGKITSSEGMTYSATDNYTIHNKNELRFACCKRCTNTHTANCKR